MLGNVVTPVMAANKTKTISSTDKMIHENVKIIKFDPVLENATPYWIIIAAGAEKQGRVAVFKYIDSSANLTKEEKIELKKFMRELWKKYRVSSIKQGNVISVSVGSRVVELSEKDEEMLKKIAQAVDEYFRANYNDRAGILWNGGTHQSIIYYSCVKYGELNYCQIASEHADDPDYWTQVPPPPGYPDWMWNFVMQVVWSWTHYYNPSYCLPNGICVPTGSAPSEAKYYADRSKDYYLRGYKHLAYENLGYASHFMTDVGNPLHTGAELRQATFKWVHYAYESYVTDNWDSGYRFASIVDYTWDYYPISNPEQATKELAGYSHRYVETLFWTIFIHPDTWQSDSTVKQITENCLHETAKYTNGLVRYMRGMVA